MMAEACFINEYLASGDKIMKRWIFFVVLSLLFLSSCTLIMPALADARIVEVENSQEDGLAVYIRDAKEGYHVTVGDQTFDCEMQDDPEGVLKCTGPGFKPGEEQVLKFFKEGDDTKPLVELVFTVPEYTEGVDSDGDGTPDIEDACPEDPLKDAPGICGCNVTDLDRDQDGTPDCIDAYPDDPAKTGDSASDNQPQTNESKDSDNDGIPDSQDQCPEDPDKNEPGVCGCGTADLDEDQDSIIDCEDECPLVAYSDLIGDPCDKDEDNDGVADGADQCPFDPNKYFAGACGCGYSDYDTDEDGTADCIDLCPEDANKTEPGKCGCGKKDKDSDGDGKLDCKDGCPTDPEKTAPGVCGCGEKDKDKDGDGFMDCVDLCPDDFGCAPDGCPVCP
jgi:hypothetical protein